MVGGWIIDIAKINNDLTRIWCVDRDGNECAVHVETEDEMPKIGEEIWWQAGRVYWDGDRRELRKRGNSYDPRTALATDREGE